LEQKIYKKNQKKEEEHNNMNDKQINDNNEKKILYSKMVTFGYLTYCKGKISIPNKELKKNL